LPAGETALENRRPSEVNLGDFGDLTTREARNKAKEVLGSTRQFAADKRPLWKEDRKTYAHFDDYRL
jgi:hypothetical protein